MGSASAFDDLPEEVEHVYLEFCDLNGLSRSKQVTIDHFRDGWEDGFPVNMLVLVQTPRNHVPVGTGYGEEIGYGDGVLRPIPSTVKRIPWRAAAVRVLCDLEYAGERVGAVPRIALERVLASNDHGLDLFAGSELEFSVLRPGEDRQPVTAHKHEWISWATEEVTPFYERLAEWGRAYDVPVQSIEHEHGPGQFEVLFEYDSPLESADRTFDFKRLVKRAAKDDGGLATFMAKPFAGESGNGYHLHVSADRDGENAFGSDDGELSETGRSFVAGVLDHADALTAFQAPTLNAFKRFSPDGFAPDTASWGFDNRMASIRIPSGTPRIENRIPSADANPYLVIATTVAAGLDGVERSLEPPPVSEGNPAGERPQLPRSPEVALRALETNDVLNDRLGEDLVGAYVANTRRGLEAFRDDVTEWERAQYMELL